MLGTLSAAHLPRCIRLLSLHPSFLIASAVPLSRFSSSARQPQEVPDLSSFEISQTHTRIGDTVIPRDDFTNVTPTILAKLSRRLHTVPGHPLNILKNRIESHFAKTSPSFKFFDTLNPIVTTKQNYDDLLTPPNHPSRSKQDSYYFNSTTLLRPHTSAHQIQMLRNGTTEFLLSADVYRRDEIDSSHYPVFHQMEGVRVFNSIPQSSSATSSPHSKYLQSDLLNLPNSNPIQDVHTHQSDLLKFTIADLKLSLDSLVTTLFSDDKNLKVRWVDAYFPFTSPSWELEIFYQGKWLEVAGCGVMRQEILSNSGIPTKSLGWAFGIGLERLAMVLFDIPDIRLFWSTDSRFISQFTPLISSSQDNNQIVKFKPYSHWAGVYKDIAFYVPSSAFSSQDSNLSESTSTETSTVAKQFHENSFNDLVRDIGGDLIEDVKCIDKFVNPKKPEKTSLCYRIMYRSMDRNLTNEEVNVLQDKLRKELPQKLDVQLR
ncbi:hypothetical protein BKA69DRAFT_1059288 [Paraphysoderma sedebokerense]|nr:hypothetical protein BKA69DRAFT_1059288 [Paraphysoderma sedebokerense]